MFLSAFLYHRQQHHGAVEYSRRRSDGMTTSVMDSSMFFIARPPYPIDGAIVSAAILALYFAFPPLSVCRNICQKIALVGTSQFYHFQYSKPWLLSGTLSLSRRRQESLALTFRASFGLPAVVALSPPQQRLRPRDEL